VAGARRGRRQIGSHPSDDSDYGSARPSAPATLFDFLTSKMSQSSSLGISYSCDCGTLAVLLPIVCNKFVLK